MLQKLIGTMSQKIVFQSMGRNHQGGREAPRRSQVKSKKESSLLVLQNNNILILLKRLSVDDELSDEILA